MICQRRWHIDGLRGVSDVRLIEGKHVLLAEGFPVQKLRQRAMDGNIEWQTEDLDSFLSFQVSAGGRVLALSDEKGQLWEINLGRKACTRLPGLLQRNPLDAIYRMTDERSIFFFLKDEANRDRTLAALIDVTTRKEFGRICLPVKFENFHGAELLLNGNLLVIYDGKVDEFNKRGKKTWNPTDRSVRPNCAIRLRNGNTVVGGDLDGIGGLAELTKIGVIAWEAVTNTDPQLIRLCFPLVRFGFSSAPASDPLGFRISQLTSKNEYIRERGIIALSNRVPKDVESLKAIIDCFDDPSERVRYYAPRILEAVGPPAIPLLLEAIKDKRERVRAEAAYVLGRKSLGHSETIIPQLISAIRDQSMMVREMAANSMGEFGTKVRSAIPVLINALDDRDPRVVRQAAYALGKVGHGDKDAVSALTKTLLHEDADCRLAAIRALGWLKRSATQAVPALTEMLAGNQPVEVKKEMIFALGEISSGANNVASIILQYTEDRALGSKSLEALAKIDPKGKSTMQALIKALKEKDRRDAALDALEKLGPTASPALPALLELQNDPDEDFRWNVRRAIRQIKKEF